MSKHDYTVPLTDGVLEVDGVKLAAEIEAALPGKPVRLQVARATTKLTCEFISDTLLTAEIAILGTTVADHFAAFNPLAKLKAERMTEVDIHSAHLFTKGAVYSAKTYSISLPAQTRLNDYVSLDDVTRLSYPVRWPTMADDDELSIEDQAALRDFAEAMFDRVREIEDGGLDLKVSIRAAATKTALDAVVDTRT